MMNFNNLFTSLEELESTAISFVEYQPLAYTTMRGAIGSFTFRLSDFCEVAEKKLLSENNGVMTWIDGQTMYVIPTQLGNAEKILLDAGYSWGDCFNNNYYVPLSNGESLLIDPHKPSELEEKWHNLKVISRTCCCKF